MAFKLELLSLAAATASLALVASPALASAPYTVAFDGDTSGAGHTVTWVSRGDTRLLVNGNAYTCTSSQLTTSFYTGTNATGNDIADVTAATWTGCTFSGLVPVTVTATGPSWDLNATGGNTSTLDDSITGSLSNVAFHVDLNFGLGPCTYDVSGGLGDTFLEDNGTGDQELDLTSSALTISNVNNTFACLGLVNNGDALTIDGSYNVPGQHVDVS